MLGLIEVVFICLCAVLPVHLPYHTTAKNPVLVCDVINCVQAGKCSDNLIIFQGVPAPTLLSLNLQV